MLGVSVYVYGMCTLSILRCLLMFTIITSFISCPCKYSLLIFCGQSPENSIWLPYKSRVVYLDIKAVKQQFQVYIL